MRWGKVSTCFLLILLSGFALGDLLTWQKNTNFDDPANWNGGGVICANDRKKFAPDMVASIFIQKNESLQELVLSNDMILTFAEGAALTFVESPGSVQSSRESSGVSSISQDATPTPSPTFQCTAKGRNVEFNATASSWFDPASWSSTEYQFGNNTRRFLLDLERVPCSKDKVVFPAENSFQVSMDQKNIDVGIIKIRGEELTNQEQLDKYWGSEQAGYDLVNRTDTGNNLSGERCDPEDYCVCDKRYADDTAKEAVCKYMKSTADLTSVCSKPVTPRYGQCNPICGAIVHFIVHQDAYNTEEIHSAILTALEKYPSVLYSIGPFRNSTVDILLKDTEGDGLEASRSVCDIQSQITFNTTSYIEGITEVKFERSDGADSCYVKPTYSPNIVRTKFDYLILGVALGIGIIFIILVAAGIALYRRRYKTSYKTELELGDINNGNRLTSQGFDNPVYNSPAPFDDSFVITYETNNEQIAGFENTGYVPGPDVKQKTAPKSSPEKKVSLEEPGEPAAKKSKQKTKKSKVKADLGFDNPVYDIRDQENTDSMVSVSLEEDDIVIPEHVEHDGVGFANPIATGLSESQMSADADITTTPSAKENGAKSKKTAGKAQGIENPLYQPAAGEQEGTSSDSTASPHEIKVQATTQSSKKKKGKKSKKNKPTTEIEESGDLGFGNPMYGGADNSMDFYQPETERGDDFLPPDN